jgi:hypothetical protein
MRTEARGYDLDPTCELPYGPAASDGRNRGRTDGRNPTTRHTSSRFQRRRGRRRVAGAGQLARGDRLTGLVARKQPAHRPGLAPPLPQQLQQVRREHDVAVPGLRRGRLLRPLPCSTRISMRALSMSPILRWTISEMRSPQP